MKIIVFPIFFLFAIIPHVVLANDCNVGFSAGGLVIKDEKRISIESEELYISENRIQVSYIFKNHSKENITTEVAFPIPEYGFLSEQPDWPVPEFDNFSVEVNGVKIDREKEVKAFIENKEVTAILKEMGLPIEDFGREDPPKSFFSGLSSPNKKKCIKSGITDERGFPLWTVKKKYHWTQTFPAGSEISVKHSYAPNLWSGLDGYLKDACLDESASNWIANNIHSEVYSIAWLEYILTTANSWKQPIKKFHLIIERKAGIISFCFDYPVKKTSPGKFEAEVENFIPKKDLKIFFIK